MRTLAVVAILVLACGHASSTAQRPFGLPRMTIPEAPQQERDEPDQPMFRAEVTRVEVSALVLDREGKPVRGLTADDFEVFENGMRQVVRSFTPFTYEPDLLVLPDPVVTRVGDDVPPASTPASNYYASASRVFALILDDLHVDVRRTQVARAAARRLVEQLSPSDLLFVVTTSSSESTGYFTRDRRTALRMIDGFMGQRLLNQTVARRQEAPSGGGVQHDDSAGRYDHYLRLTSTIRDVSLALRDVNGRRKTVILLSEGSSFGAGMENMAVRMPQASDRARVNASSGTLRLMNEALAAAAAGNVAVYPLSPVGLGNEEADLMRGFGAVDATALMAVLTEAQQAKEMMRDLAALTGGVSLVDTNDLLAGIDRAVRDASSHYVLTYEPDTPAKGNEYRTIEVKVRRPGVRVLARRGYRAPGVRPPPAMKVPGSLPAQLRTLLAGVMPDDGLPMRVQAVPVSRAGKRTTVAVVVEVNGTLLGAQADGALRVEQGLLTVNGTGKADNGMRRTFDLTLTPVQQQVLAGTGLRSVWAVDLPNGTHQLRVASVDTMTGRGGSVYLDVHVSDDVAQAPGALVASRFLSMMPTAFADTRLARWTAAMPTATRVFPAGDVLTVTVPHDPATQPTVHLATEEGRVVWEGAGTPVDGAVQFVVPLDGIGSAVGDLVVRNAHGAARTTIGIVGPPDAVKP
jgi:VWFA-related protein